MTELNKMNASDKAISFEKKVKAQRIEKRVMDSILVLFMVGMLIYFSFASKYFLSVKNFMNIFSSVSIVGIISVGMTLVMITKGIDLSVSSTIAVSGCITALMIEGGCPDFIGFIVGIFSGVLIGLLNGFLITKFRLVPFIVTLGTLNIARGVAFIMTNGQAIYTRSPLIKWLGTGKFFNLLPVPGCIMIVLFVLGWALCKFTVFGRQVFCIGGNKNASRLSGINVNKVIFLLYIIIGALAGLAGMVMAGITSTAMPSAGDGYNLDCITAVYLGGNSSEGGEGSVWRTFLGIMIIGILNNGMALLSVQNYWQTSIKGCLLILAVIVDELRRRK